MKVILAVDVRKLGKAGEVIVVSDGFARNFLFPRHLAQIADEQGIARVAARKHHLEQADKNAQKATMNLITGLTGRTLDFSLPGDAAGHLYAGLKESEILAKISGGDTGVQKGLKLEGYTPIKRAGTHDVTLRGAEGSVAKFKLVITCRE